MYNRSGSLDATRNVEQYVPLVRRLAHYMVARLPSSVQVEDLIQAGLIGLLDALGRYEDGQGARFETYATQRIKGAMLDELRRGDWLPRGLRQLQRKIETAMHRLEHRNGRAPTETEMATEMKISLLEYQEMLSDAKGSQLKYFDEYDNGDDAESYLDRHVADTTANPEGRLLDRRYREAIIGAIEDLPEREKLVMGLYYEQEMNFKEVAAVLGVTESRICQLHTQAVARIRSKVRDWSTA